MTERVALYLQDSHDLRDGLDYAKYAEEKREQQQSILIVFQLGVEIFRQH